MSSGAAVTNPGLVAPEGVKKSVFRPDIQGLRMIAVLAVIADHLFHWPSGGFVGVDVFFVISGFLITSLILREHDKTGRISFRGFYSRRARRILPAAVLVLIVTVTASWYLSSQTRFQQTFWDAVWALFFSANWNYAIQDTDYFQADGAVSPLQHFWSLSVEEQFYFVWPWLILLIFSLVPLTRGTSRRAYWFILATIVTISAVSFAWALWESTNSPTWAYFSTLSRAWELGAGATLAVIAGTFSRLAPWLRTTLAWTGIIGIAASLFTVSDENGGFPAPWALLPVAATALVIISGTGGDARFTWPLANPVSSYIGDISYSLYLWHFPFIILLTPLFPETNWFYFTIILLFIFGTSVLSYHFIEDPIRRWEPKTKKSRRRRPQSRSPVVPVLGMSAVALLTVGLATWALLPRTSSAAVEYVPRHDLGTVTGEPAAVNLPPALAARQEAITEALRASAWPIATDPSLDLTAEEAYVPEWTVDDCLDTTVQDLQRCVYGDLSAAETVALIGDSTAISIMPLLREVYPDMRIQALTRGQCPAGDVQVTRLGGNPFPECSEHRIWVNEWITQNRPAVVVLTDAGTTLDRMTVGDEAANVAAYGDGLARTLQTIAAAAGQVVVLHSPPQSRSLEECKTPVSSPADCVADVGGTYEKWAEITTSATTTAAWPNVKDVPVIEWFCSDRSCPAFVGNIRTFAGGSHLTAPAARATADLYREALDR